MAGVSLKELVCKWENASCAREAERERERESSRGHMT